MCPPTHSSRIRAQLSARVRADLGRHFGSDGGALVKIDVNAIAFSGLGDDFLGGVAEASDVEPLAHVFAVIGLANGNHDVEPPAARALRTHWETGHYKKYAETAAKMVAKRVTRPMTAISLGQKEHSSLGIRPNAGVTSDTAHASAAEAIADITLSKVKWSSLADV